MCVVCDCVVDAVCCCWFGSCSSSEVLCRVGVQCFSFGHVVKRQPDQLVLQSTELNHCKIRCREDSTVDRVLAERGRGNSLCAGGVISLAAGTAGVLAVLMLV